MFSLPCRRSIRLQEYDYSKTGIYYITLCAQNRELFFENNDTKELVNNQWQKLPNKFPNINLDEHIIMPNHLHGIIVINNVKGNGRGDPCGRPYNDCEKGNHKGYPYKMNLRLGDIIGAFKSITTNQYIRGIKINNWPMFNKRLWQRNYYEHIIRNQKSLNKIRIYIKNNPGNWDKDRNNPKNFKK